MLIVTIFLGGWALPFFSTRDGIAIEFGNLKLIHALVPRPGWRSSRTDLFQQSNRRLLGADVRALDRRAA